MDRVDKEKVNWDNISIENSVEANREEVTEYVLPALKDYGLEALENKNLFEKTRDKSGQLKTKNILAWNSKEEKFYVLDRKQNFTIFNRIKKIFNRGPLQNLDWNLKTVSEKIEGKLKLFQEDMSKYLKQNNKDNEANKTIRYCIKKIDATNIENNVKNKNEKLEKINEKLKPTGVIPSNLTEEERKEKLKNDQLNIEKNKQIINENKDNNVKSRLNIDQNKKILENIYILAYRADIHKGTSHLLEEISEEKEIKAEVKIKGKIEEKKINILYNEGLDAQLLALEILKNFNETKYSSSISKDNYTLCEKIIDNEKPIEEHIDKNANIKKEILNHEIVLYPIEKKALIDVD